MRIETVVVAVGSGAVAGMAGLLCGAAGVVSACVVMALVVCFGWWLGGAVYWEKHVGICAFCGERKLLVGPFRANILIPRVCRECALEYDRETRSAS